MNRGKFNRLFYSSRIYPGTPIGIIFSDKFNRVGIGTNYVTEGIATWAADGTKLTTSSGTGAFSDLIRRSFNPTCLENHTISVDFKITVAIGALTYGLSFGVYSSNANDRRSYSIQFQTSSGANLGKTYVRTSTGAGTPVPTLDYTSVGSVAVNTNDSLRILITRNKNVLNWTVSNLTLGTNYSETYTFPLAYTAGVKVPHGGGQYSIHSLGGTLDITDWTVSSVDKKNVKTLFVGDSITYGLFSGAIADRWPNKTMLGSVNALTVSGGPSDKTSEVLERIKELILINPKYAVLMFGGNDVLFAVPAATQQANYLSVVNQLKAAGIIVIHCYATPRDATNLTAWNAYILATYGATDKIIDVFNPLTTTPNVSTDLAIAYDSSDGTHPNPAGHALVGSTIFLNFPSIR